MASKPLHRPHMHSKNNLSRWCLRAVKNRAWCCPHQLMSTRRIRIDVCVLLSSLSVSKSSIGTRNRCNSGLHNTCRRTRWNLKLLATEEGTSPKKKTKTWLLATHWNASAWTWRRAGNVADGGHIRASCSVFRFLAKRSSLCIDCSCPASHESCSCSPKIWGPTLAQTNKNGTRGSHHK